MIPCHPLARCRRYLRIFLERWQARQPVVVRAVQSRMQWGPEVMQRATRENGSKRFKTDCTDSTLQVRGLNARLEQRKAPPAHLGLLLLGSVLSQHEHGILLLGWTYESLWRTWSEENLPAVHALP